LPDAPALLAQASSTEVSPCPPTDALCTAVWDATGNAALAGSADALILRPLRIVLIILLAILASFVVRRVVRRFTEGLQHEGVQRRLLALRARAPRALPAPDPIANLRRIQRAETIGALLRSIGIATVWTLAIFSVLEQVGIDAGPLIAGAGIIGVALGFGAQNLVRDFLSGIFMLIEDQYGVGDVVDAGEASGRVEAVSLRSTRLRDVDGTLWHIPNGEIRRIGNKSQGWSRALLDIEIPMDAGIGAATEIIKATADGLWKAEAWSELVLEEPEVWGVERMSANGVTLRAVVKTRPLEQWKVARELRARIKLALEEAGIGLAQPTVLLQSAADEAVPRPAAEDEDGPLAGAARNGDGRNGDGRKSRG
jgi:small-conductance mechanosensitive channel